MMMILPQLFPIESKYHNLEFLLPTSELLENFFSTTGLALSEHLEQQFFLKAINKLWTIETVSKIVNK